MNIFTAVDMLTNSAIKFPKKVSIKDEQTGITYEELKQRAE